jgi:hypothetical protein
MRPHWFSYAPTLPTEQSHPSTQSHTNLFPGEKEEWGILAEAVNMNDSGAQEDRESVRHKPRWHTSPEMDPNHSRQELPLLPAVHAAITLYLSCPQSRY